MLDRWFAIQKGQSLHIAMFQNKASEWDSPAFKALVFDSGNDLVWFEQTFHVFSNSSQMEEKKKRMRVSESDKSFAKEIQMRKREWIHWESANNGVRWEYKASCWENGESWRTELTKWISHLLKGSRMLRDPKNPVHSIASCPRSIALRTHFNGNHFDRKFSESHIFLFLLLNPHTTTKTRKKQTG